MVLRHHFAGVVSEERRVPQGRAIGLSSVGGSFKTLFMGWFKNWAKHRKGGWNEICRFMQDQECSESNKQAWESSTDETDGLAYIHGLLMSVSMPEVGSDLLLARALADYVNPPIQIDGDLVYFDPRRGPTLLPTATLSVTGSWRSG